MRDRRNRNQFSRNQFAAIGYFAWAVEGLPRVRSIVDEELDGPHRGRLWYRSRESFSEIGAAIQEQAALSLTENPRLILFEPELFFGIDDRVDTSPDRQEQSYEEMLASFIGALGGERLGLEYAAALMIRGGLNRRLTIARFLGVASLGEIGIQNARIPTERDVQNWARRIQEPMQVQRDRVQDLAWEYLRAVVGPPPDRDSRRLGR